MKNHSKFLMWIWKKKLLCSAFLLWLGILIFTYVFHEIQKNYVKRKWAAYQKRELSKSHRFIQKKFTKLERISFQTLDSLLKKKVLSHELTYWKSMESRSRIFKHILEFKFTSEENLRGIAIYKNKVCQAWRGWVFNLINPGLLEECRQNGSRFSTIIYSEKKGEGDESLYAFLCTFVPIPHHTLAKEKVYVGVAVAFLPLDTNYPISTRYIKSQSFAKEMQNLCQLQKVKIYFKDQYKNFSPSQKTPTHIKTNLLRGFLHNLNGEPLATIILCSFPRDVVLKNIKDRLHLWQKFSTSIFLLFFVWQFLLQINFISQKIIRTLSALFVIWSARYFLFFIDFPAQALPLELSEPNVFCIGDLFSSLGGLILTSITCSISCWLWLKWMPPFLLFRTISKKIAKRRLYNIFYSIGFLIDFGLCFLFLTFLYNILFKGLESIVEHSHFRLLRFIEFFPHTKAISVYISIYLFGISTILLNIWVFKSFVLQKKSFFLYIIFSIFILGQIFVEHYFLYIPLKIALLCILFCSCASIFRLIRFPKRFQLRYILVIAMVAFATYPIINYASRKKMRDIVEGRASEYQNTSVLYTLEDSLDKFEQQSKLVKALENIAVGERELLFRVANYPYRWIHDRIIPYASKFPMPYVKEFIGAWEKVNYHTLLNMGIFPEQLKWMFRNNGYPVSKRINVEIVKKNHSWIIRDIGKKQKYSIEREREELKIYGKNVIDEENNIAFLLWANSPLAERLDNVKILIYAKTTALDSLLLRQDQLWTPPGEYFYLISDFSLNTFYEDNRILMSKVNLTPKKRNMIQNIRLEENSLFCVATTPIFSSENQFIGFVVVLTQYPKILRSLPLSEIFSRRSNDSFHLMAYFEGQTMLDINNPYMSKNFRPSKKVIQTVDKEQLWLWREEKIGGIPYDNLYFPLTIHRNPSIIEKRIAMIGYIKPSLLSRFFYLLRFFLCAFCFLFIPFWVYQLFVFLSQETDFWKKGCFRNYEHKILTAFLFVSGIPVLVMGISSKESAVKQIHESYEKNLIEHLNNAEKEICQKGFTPMTPEDTGSCWIPDNSFCYNWGKRNRRMLNVFLAHQLLATNRPELFQTDLLSRQLSGKAYYNLYILKKEVFITIESLADYTFVVGYKALSSPQDKRQVVGALAIPMIYQQAEVQRKVSEMIVTIFTLYVGIFFLVMLAGILFAHQITRPLAKLIEGLQRVSTGDLDFQLSVHSQDEFGQLVDAFNHMTKDLKVSRKKLIQAEKDAAWREMARQIAHEIKNPLTPMKLSAQHIHRAYRDQSHKFPKILEKGISTIIDAIDSLSRTASTFSEFAKFIKPSLGAHSIYPMLQECLDLFSHYQEQNISFDFNFEESLKPISTDPHHLKRVIINILTNAVQAIEKEKGHIHIACYQEVSETDMITLRIRDNGGGIPENIQPRLFEPNFSTKSHGSGLGLAICKRAIDQMGGNIWIQSQEGSGTTVFIKLPIAQEKKDLL